MNTLTYILKLQDRMSATLDKIGAHTNTTTREVRNLKGEVDGLNKSNLNGFFSSIKKLSAVLGVGAIIGKTIKDGMEQEMRNTSFEVLFGGAESAKRIIDEISHYAAVSPYGKVGLSEATQMMAGFGIAQDRIMPNLRMIGDIAMGDAGKFQSLSLAFAQMSSAGKLTGQDLMQMINGGFNPLDEMARTTGKSISALKDEMAKGLITSDKVIEAFRSASSEGGKFYGMIDRINDTVGGQWASAMDGAQEKLLALYDNVLQPILLPALKMLNVFLEDPLGSLASLADSFISKFPVITTLVIAATGALLGHKLMILGIAAVQGVIGALRAALVAYEIVVFAVKNSTSMWTAAQWLLNVALGANPVGLIVAGVVALIAVIAFLIVKIDGWGKAWKHTVQGAKYVWFSYIEYVKSSFNVMLQSLMIGINKIKQGWYSFKDALGIGDSSENQRMLAQISADTEARKQSMITGAKKTAEYAKMAGQEFAKAAGSFSWNKTTFADVAKGIKGKLGISQATVPGADVAGVGAVGTGSSGSVGSKSSAGRDTANSIATGGNKTTHISVSIAEMGNDMKIYVGSVDEGASEIRDKVLDELTRALSMAQSQA